MDIISHTLAGIAVATAVAALATERPVDRGRILCCGGLGGVLPDLDTISLWSGFDGTLGSFFQLPAKGRDIYFSNFWYSHHNFAHSLLGGLLISCALLLPLALPLLVTGKRSLYQKGWRQLGIYGLALLAGYSAHLLGDLPTPSHSWGGIKLFWPLPVTSGGSGRIWWWNNYDLFLLLALACTLNLGLLGLSARLKKAWRKILPTLICLAVFLLLLRQIEGRQVDFNNTGYRSKWAECEEKSLEQQQELLGQPLYHLMRQFDALLPSYF
ncbi:MAG: metal-dependent hydrolase [Desulfuromonadaceae bacterium]